jgi:hypothetical protein
LPKTLTYEEWLKRKSAAFQKEVLGPGTYRLWKATKISLRDLIDQRGSPLTLDQLKHIDEVVEVSRAQSALRTHPGSPKTKFSMTCTHEGRIS